MKLQQGQIWKKGEEFFRIVEWARMSIDYKATKDPVSGEGTRHVVTKKEFCRLIKGAELCPPGQADQLAPQAGQAEQVTAQPAQPAQPEQPEQSEQSEQSEQAGQAELVTTKPEPLTMLPRPGNGS